MTDNLTNRTADISVEKTEHLKGLAVLLLMWHHLFGVGYITDWIEIIPNSKNIVFIFGASSKICLAIFLFCSGYGLFKSYISKEMPRKNYILRRLVKIFIPYWMIMAIAIGYLAYAGKFDPKYFFVNLFVLNISDEVLYTSFAWFVKLYILLILITPLIKMIELKWKKNIFLDLLIYIAVPFAAAVLFGKFIEDMGFTGFPALLMNSVLLVIAWLPLFSVGMLASKYEVYNLIRKAADKLPRLLCSFLMFVIICFTFFVRYMTNLYIKNTVLYPNCMLDVIYGPIVIGSLIIILDNLKYKSRYVIPFIGRNSIHYWLLSGMFFHNTIELAVLITWPRGAPFILIWTMVLLTPFVFLCSWLSDKAVKLIFKGS
jgi:hypothetical protein